MVLWAFVTKCKKTLRMVPFRGFQIILVRLNWGKNRINAVSLFSDSVSIVIAYFILWRYFVRYDISAISVKMLRHCALICQTETRTLPSFVFVCMVNIYISYVWPFAYASMYMLEKEKEIKWGEDCIWL